MDSLIILIFLTAYVVAGIAAAYWGYRFVTRRNLGLASRIATPIIVLVTFWAIPGLDHELGKLSYEELCKAQAGYSTFRVAPSVEGYRTPFATETTPVDLGFKYVEREESDGHVTRFSVLEGGKVYIEKNAIAKSAFALRKQEDRIDATCYQDGVQHRRGLERQRTWAVYAIQLPGWVGCSAVLCNARVAY